jgi:tetratricopeptide (TPR) repeat protein
MPSQPSLRRLTLPEGRRHGCRAATALLLLAACLAVADACTSAPKPLVRPPVRPPEPLAFAPADRPYLIDPFEGFSGNVDPERRDRLTTTWHDLLERGETAAASRIAGEMLAEDPQLFPAQVLVAQVELAAEDDRAVLRRLLPVGDALPTYTASQLLLGRASEHLGDFALAYSAYRAVAARSPLALKRVNELHSRALEIVANRLDEALRSGKLPDADKELELLRSWAPSESLTFEAARKVAVSRGDHAAELTAVKELVSRRPDDRQLLERRSELELEIGDPSAGLKIVQNLAGEHPDDPALAQKLDSAKFRWRLSQLPRDVQEVAAKPDLSRADFAVLLYWLVPDVRNSRPTAGRIATDVLDNPHQEEIVRVVNLGLMDVDPTLHRFSPGSSIRRGPALRAVLRTLASFGVGACAGPAGSSGGVCDPAVACGLLDADEDCEPTAPLAGSDAVEILRRSVKILGGS